MLYKYPKTNHLPWSPHNKRDDRKLKDTSCFMGRNVVVTEKMDGENTTLYRDHIHARSLSSADHPSRSWVKGLWGEIRHNIPEGMRICGENLYAKHSIGYNNLDSFFLVFSIWIDDLCLSWADTIEYCHLLDLRRVPYLFDGKRSKANYSEPFDNTLKIVAEEWEMNNKGSEGYVVRVADSFRLDEWDKSIAKYVRPNHIQTDEHWMEKEVEPNVLLSHHEGTGDVQV